MSRRTLIPAIGLGVWFLLVAQTVIAQPAAFDCPGNEEGRRCGEGQVGICWIDADSSAYGCLTPPEDVSGLDLDLWLLSYVLDDTLTVTDESVVLFREIIHQGRWKRGDRTVIFTLPADWKGSR